MKQKTKLISWLVAGCILGLGPLWGKIGTVVGMLMAFNDLSRESGGAESLANDISIALLTTLVGWVVCPIGIVIIVVAIRRLNVNQRDEK